MQRRRRMWVPVVAVVAALLAACGSGDPAAPAAAAGESGEPQAGGTLRVMQQSEPRTLDPALLGNDTTQNTLVGNALYGHLLVIDTDGEVEFGLAEDISSSDGGTTWQLTVRDGLTFSDGTPFDAAAVQFNWERLTDPSLGSPTASIAVFIESMSASGQTLDFTLTQPIARFDSAIADRTMNWIASPQALEAGAQAFDANPIGAGPFLLDSWQRNGEMVLVRNEDYFDSPRPYLDRLVLTANADASQRFATLQAGGTDAVLASNPDLVAIAEEEGMRAAYLDLSGALTMAMNTRMAPFDDVRARQGVSRAVDPEVINSVVYQGYGEVPETMFAEGSPYNGDTTLPAYDPEAAQELFDGLAAEGTPLEFTITAYQTTQSRRTAEAIQAQLNQYDDVQVEIEVLDFPAALGMLAQRTFQMIASGVSFENPAPHLSIFLHSSSSGNVSGISDAALDAALTAGLSATDEEARTEAYQQVAERYSELASDFSYVRWQASITYDEHVHGVELYGIGALRTDTLWVTE